jgi:hypothetical protein|tara:strand:+ start:4985 stop:5185 length:201 start_codon:yes stop_codon:yes gene_type:complete
MPSILHLLQGLVSRGTVPSPAPGFRSRLFFLGYFRFVNAHNLPINDQLRAGRQLGVFVKKVPTFNG